MGGLQPVQIAAETDTLMVQGYYTLDEAAHLLGMSADELKQLARKGELRSFQDQGTWRFRIQDIQEMVRRRAGGSDLELPGGHSLPEPTDSPVPRSPKPQTRPQADDVFGFSLAPEEGTDPGDEINLDRPTGPGSSKKGSSARRQAQGGSDSDVRLVGERGDAAFRKPTDSDVKVGGESGSKSGPKSGPRSSKRGMGGPASPKPPKSRSHTPNPTDSGVRLVPMDSDSDVRITGSDTDDIRVPIGVQPPKGATDSDIRLEMLTPLGRDGGHEGPLTEEINLDEELKKDEARRKASQAKSKSRKSDLPKKSPFELSESELDLRPGEAEEAEEAQDKDSSSDFELTPASESSSPLELGSSDDFRLDVPDESLALAEDYQADHKEPLSGVNLAQPADSGISLEQNPDVGSDSEFELTLEEEPAGPKSSRPSTPKPASQKLVQEEAPDSSEFELSLDVDQAAAPPDSDSEFELSLDDTGGLAQTEGEQAAESGEKDIFETDFEVPALEETSGSEGVEVEDVDTDLENPDFEIAMGEEDIVAGEEDSSSEVMALDEEALEDDVATAVQPKHRGKKKKAGADEDEDFEDLDQLDDDALLAEEGVGAGAAAVPQAPWGVLPVAVLFPCVIVMVLLGMMGLELAQTQQGYKPGVLSKTIGGLMGAKK
jgi:excisionase family DNA binding protein